MTDDETLISAQEAPDGAGQPGPEPAAPDAAATPGEDAPSQAKAKAAATEAAAMLLHSEAHPAMDLCVPDGFEADPQALDGFKKFAAEQSISAPQAQALIDYYFGQTRQAMESQAGAYQQRVQQWGESAKADRELGGNGLEANLATAKKAVEKFASNELRQMLLPPSADNPDGLGLGNHPEVIRLFYRIGRTLGGDTLHIGGEPSIEDRLANFYPTMRKG